MTVSGFWALLIVLGTTLTFFNFSSSSIRASWFPDLVSTDCADSTTMIAVSRKLKENGSGISSNKKGDVGHVTLDDYGPIDPVPSSPSTKYGPIEHSSPLIPFIPKPSPPAHPKAGDST